MYNPNPDIVTLELHAIVGFEIEIKNIIGQSKKSQNHPLTNRLGVIEGLKSQAKDNVADWIEKSNM